jgi:glycosyltransferase involved in cell wall biosynthesis
MNASRPRVSVITPCYNAETFVAETVRSVLGQTYADWEYILVDDGSRDSTLALLEELAALDSRIRVIHQDNGGVARARNTGAQYISETVEYAIFLDADDCWLPTTLERLVKTLDSEPSCVAAFGFVQKIDASGRPLEEVPQAGPQFEVKGTSVREVFASRYLGFGHMASVTPISTPGACLVRSSALRATDLFDPAVVPCEDWDLWITLSAMGPFRFLDELVLRYRQHPGNASGSHARMRRQRQAVYDKHLERWRNDPQRQRAIGTAMPFGMYGFDSLMCRRWTMQQLRSGDVLGAIRLAVRSVRFEYRYLRARSLRQSLIAEE